DIHSPRVPETAEVTDLLRAALQAVPSDRLWVNPDCGLKTRGYAEVEPALRHMTAAAAEVRKSLWWCGSSSRTVGVAGEPGGRRRHRRTNTNGYGYSYYNACSTARLS